MLFLELAAQAVRGFSPSIRAALKPGYVALKSPGDLPSPLAGLIGALAFPDGRGGDASFLAPGAKAGRAGLSIQGTDGSVWRIVRDLGGAGGLHKLNRTTNAFDVVTQDATEMSQWLRSSTGFPVRTTWEQLFTLNGPQLPTRRPKAPPRQPGAPAAKGKTGLQSSWNMDVGSSGPENKIAALEAELAAAKRANELQFKLDGLNSEAYDLESKAKSWEALREKVQAARAELAAFNAQNKGMPDDIVARAKRYPEERKRFEEQVQRVRDDRHAAESIAPRRPDPLWKDQQFIGALVAGLALFIGAFFLEGGLRFIAVLAMVPFSFAALLALRFIEELQVLTRQGGKTEVLDTQEKKLVDEFQMTTVVVQNAFQAVNALTLDEFLVTMGRKDVLASTVAQLELEYADIESNPEFGTIAARAAEKKREADAINDELLSMSGGYVRDVREIEREIQKLTAPEPTPAVTPADGFSAVSTTPKETWDDPTPPLMMLATDLFSTDVPSLWSVLHDRAVQYLTALSDRRYHGISVDKDGHATLEAPGRQVKATELPGKDLDLMYLALRLTLIEKAAATHKVPVVIEDTFNTVLDPAKQPLFGRMLKHLGSLTQVLHVSGAGQNASLADSPAPL